MFLPPALVTFSWKFHWFDLQLLNPRKQLNSQCWLPWANKICGRESSLCCATVPVTCQLAPASSAKLVKSFWSRQIFFQLKPGWAKLNTCWQSKVQIGIPFGDQSNAIYIFLKENKKWAVKVLKKKTKLSYSCVWISVLGLSIRCCSPRWIISESSCLVQGLCPSWGTSQTNFRWILKHNFKPNFPANWVSLGFMLPLDSEVSDPSCWQRRKMFPEGGQVYTYLYVWNKNVWYGGLIGNHISRRQKGIGSVLIKIVLPHKCLSSWILSKQPPLLIHVLSEWLFPALWCLSKWTVSWSWGLRSTALLSAPGSHPKPIIANTNLDYY